MSRETNEWLITANPQSVAAEVKLRGVITFYGNGLTEHENAVTASRTITSLDDDNTKLVTFYIPSRDDSYESITYEVLDSNAEFAFVTIQRRIKYKDFGIGARPDKVDIGPMYRREGAQELCDLLNKQIGG